VADLGEARRCLAADGRGPQTFVGREIGPGFGFVVAPTEQAIIANWVRGDGMWHVDVTGRTSVVRRCTEVAGDVSAHSIIPGASPVARLQAVAHYLELDWSWLTRRCGQLGRHGTARLVRTRSHLVSPAGLDSACRFVGSLPSNQ
jgi:hypothetical protein